MYSLYSSLVCLYWLLYELLCSITTAHLCSYICLRQWLCLVLALFIGSLAICGSTYIHHVGLRREEGVPSLHGNMATIQCNRLILLNGLCFFSWSKMSVIL